ncbi:hypothetical protein DL766_007378 [Monosporascus sp. MC13-8B]|nr:hypothetical protein DL766_007378 [Monosporascus sp. MC13-8B]
MASDASIDVSQLTAEQQSALEQYTAVTAQDVKDAVPLLQRSQWNVQIAVSKFFDGEGPDPLAEATAAQDHGPQQAPRHENLQDSFGRPSPRRPADRRGRPDPAPRIVPQPQTPTHRPPFLLALLFGPFNIGYRAVSTLFRTFVYILSFLPAPLRPRAITTTVTRGWRGTMGRRMLLPRDTAARFRREFEEEYGDHENASRVPFFEGGFAQALDAAKAELKFLLVVLVSPEHDDTTAFMRDTLLANPVVAFLTDPSNNLLVWGGNVLDSEAYQVATEYNCTKFPFSCLVCLTPREHQSSTSSSSSSSTRMSIVKRLPGLYSPTTYLAELQAAMTKYAPDLASARAERAAQEVARSLRSEQDSAYERSLARDRERARQRREAEAAARDAEKRALEEAEAAERRERNRQQWRRWRAGTVAPEPGPGEEKVVRVALKMPEASGAGRIVRRFRADSTVEELYAFVECFDLLQSRQAREEDEKAGDGDGDGDDDDDYEPPEDYEHEYRFRVASLMPRVVYEPDAATTLGERIGRSGNLIVEDLHDDEDEEGGEDGGGGGGE